MTSAELSKIVERWGGVDNFARLMHVQPRTVYRWLDGSRKLSPMAAALIRTLG